MIETLASLATKAGHRLPDIPRRRSMAATPAYDAGSGSSRTRGWTPVDRGINDLIFSDLEQLRGRSRDMVRRNPWATNAVDSFVANSIGTGIVPLFQHPDPAEKERLQKLWLRWTDEADLAGRSDFYGLQSLATRMQIESGECLVRLRPQSLGKGLSVPLQLQLLPADHLPIYGGAASGEGNTVRFGIEYDSEGNRVAYHLYRENPNESWLLNAPGQEISRVPAGDVLHLFKPVDASQQRGLPWLTPVLATLYDLEKYDVAELVRKKSAAMIVGFEVTTQAPESDPVFGNRPNANGVGDEGLQPGMYYSLPYGKDVRFNNPADVGTMYTEFMRFQLRKIAAGCGISYEMLTWDLTGVNYSSIRSGSLEFRRRCEQFQHQVTVYQFCRPVLAAWTVAAIIGGQIRIEDYRKNPEWYTAEWRPPAWDWVDPLKDVQAEILAIDNLLKSRSAAIADLGYDREEVDRVLAADQKSEREKGLVRGANTTQRIVQEDGQMQEESSQKSARRLSA